MNNVLRHTQSGVAHPGYSTIDLNNIISLRIGDIFEVIFKITVDGEAAFPISEAVSLNHKMYSENISFLSYDGENWKDLYNLTWKYSTHTYDSQVACIKAFTILNPVNTTISIAIRKVCLLAFSFTALSFLLYLSLLFFNHLFLY